MRRVDPADMHPFTGREVLIVVARHSAEHQGQAELIRDLRLNRARLPCRAGIDAAALHSEHEGITPAGGGGA